MNNMVNIFDYIGQCKVNIKKDIIKLARLNFASFEDANPEKHPQTAWDVWREQCEDAFRNDIDKYLDDISYKLCQYYGINDNSFIVKDFRNILLRNIDELNLYNRENREKLYSQYGIEIYPEE